MSFRQQRAAVRTVVEAARSSLSDPDVATSHYMPLTVKPMSPSVYLHRLLGARARVSIAGILGHYGRLGSGHTAPCRLQGLPLVLLPLAADLQSNGLCSTIKTVCSVHSTQAERRLSSCSVDRLQASMQVHLHAALAWCPFRTHHEDDHLGGARQHACQSAMSLFTSRTPGAYADAPGAQSLLD